jgi:hypothetical protein
MEKVERRGHCDSCNKDGVLIVRGWTTRNKKECIDCARKSEWNKILSKPKMEKKPRKPVKVITEKQKQKFKDDAAVNRRIWGLRPHVCEECGSPLPKVPKKVYFSHLLSKGAHPELRFDDNNIVLHCEDCHQKWEFAADFRPTSVTYSKHLAYIQKHSLL